jgi:hypothetical protein
MVITANQPTVLADLVTLVADPTAAVAETTDQHGGRVAHRHRRASSEVVGDTAWPGLRQVLCRDRTVTDQRSGAGRRERADAVTARGPEPATAADLLPVWRDHWHVENQVHAVRDVPVDEDRSGGCARLAPQVGAARRNAAIGVARALGFTNIADATRCFAAQPARALAAVGLPREFD